MARLVLCLDGRELAEYNMTKERYTIGRLPDNDIRLDHPGVSGHHALVINILDDSFLEDLNSTNGTTVNGRRIAKHPLQHEDVVRIGRHELRFIDEQQEDMDADEFERTMVINTMNDSPARVEELVKQAVGSEAPMAEVDEEEAPIPPVSQRAAGAPASPARAVARALAEEMDDDPTARAQRQMPEGRKYASARAAAAGFTEPSANVPSAPPPVKVAPTLEDLPAPDAHAQRQVSVAAQPPARPSPPPGDASPGLPRGKIQVLSGTFAGKELELKKALTTLGRPGVQVAAISRRSEGFYIVHVESGKPDDYPRLNGTPIGPQAHELQDRDVIELAGVKMGFFRV